MTTKIYTISGCVFCQRAKSIMDREGLAYDEVNLSADLSARRELVKETGHRTFPQVFISGRFVGGCRELDILQRQGRIRAILD